jgi:DNA-binding response OmpR family regulator
MATRRRSSTHRSSRPPSSRGRVIIAEDDAAMRRLLASTLRRDGYEVTETANGLQLFEALQRAVCAAATPAFIVSDVRMPGGSGLQVLEAMRIAGWSVPVVLITAFGDEDVMCEGARLGAACVLSKPFDMDDLRAVAAVLTSPLETPNPDVAAPTCGSPTKG